MRLMAPSKQKQQQQPKMAAVQDKRKLFSTYRKQKDRLKKIAYELAAVCGVEVAVMSINLSGRVDAWPENPDQVLRIFDRYAKHLQELDKGESPSLGVAGEPPSTSSTLPEPPSSSCPMPQLLQMNAAMLCYVEKRIRMLKAQESRMERSENSATLEVKRERAAAVAGAPTASAPRRRSFSLFNGGGMVQGGFGIERSRNNCGMEMTRSSVQWPEGAALVDRAGNLGNVDVVVNMVRS